ncbi:hypothetical protein BT63DRAFT_481494 [Microthyrium microscopicum]|uniref:F-box domain-containing protein n=1 Tax=Microthyrium microscopicum TaxID=703497 RepID=A0A6A6U6W8_9PEZI|nr:hypothetical protein BT63DRAFT_481494 [Microthyrium microscopicum]
MSGFGTSGWSFAAVPLPPLEPIRNILQLPPEIILNVLDTIPPNDLVNLLVTHSAFANFFYRYLRTRTIEAYNRYRSILLDRNNQLDMFPHFIPVHRAASISRLFFLTLGVDGIPQNYQGRGWLWPTNECCPFNMLDRYLSLDNFAQQCGVYLRVYTLWAERESVQVRTMPFLPDWEVRNGGVLEIAKKLWRSEFTVNGVTMDGTPHYKEEKVPGEVGQWLLDYDYDDIDLGVNGFHEMAPYGQDVYPTTIEKFLGGFKHDAIHPKVLDPTSKRIVGLLLLLIHTKNLSFLDIPSFDVGTQAWIVLGRIIAKHLIKRAVTAGGESKKYLPGALNWIDTIVLNSRGQIAPISEAKSHLLHCLPWLFLPHLRKLTYWGTIDFEVPRQVGLEFQSTVAALLKHGHRCHLQEALLRVQLKNELENSELESKHGGIYNQTATMFPLLLLILQGVTKLTLGAHLAPHDESEANMTPIIKLLEQNLGSTLKELNLSFAHYHCIYKTSHRANYSLSHISLTGFTALENLGIHLNMLKKPRVGSTRWVGIPTDEQGKFEKMTAVKLDKHGIGFRKTEGLPIKYLDRSTFVKYANKRTTSAGVRNLRGLDPQTGEPLNRQLASIFPSSIKVLTLHLMAYDPPYEEMASIYDGLGASMAERYPLLEKVVVWHPYHAASDVKRHLRSRYNRNEKLVREELGEPNQESHSGVRYAKHVKRLRKEFGNKVVVEDNVFIYPLSGETFDQYRPQALHHYTDEVVFFQRYP